MQRILIICFLLLSGWAFSQNEILAKQYFDKGEFEKAASLYTRLYQNQPRKFNYFENLVACYQQLEDYAKAESLLLEKVDRRVFPPQLLVEVGYNYLLQEKKQQADSFFEKALNKVVENPNYAYMIGNSFQKKSLLDQALKAYTIGMELNPRLNYNFQVARIYGELGDIAKMYDSYLSMLTINESYQGNVLRNIGQFVNEDPTNENNILLRRTLLKKLQEEPNVIWNEILSWLFIQQKQYDKAFVQEKAIFNRSEVAMLTRIIDLAEIAILDESTETAKEILSYIVETSNDPQTELNAEQRLLQIDIASAQPDQHEVIETKFKRLFNTYGKDSETIDLQVAHARFLAFHKDEPQRGISELKEALNLRLSRYQNARIKIALGDILVYDEKFNQALIYYTQAQKNIKNDVLAQEARFKVAQTSYYKGDFEWAETQLKVLKSSTSQLIANDALQLKLLISDNAFQDSTLTALKIYAKADLLAYQKKDTKAIALLDQVLQNHKGEKIEDEALLMQGKLFEKQKRFEKARLNYVKILEFYPDDILTDDALFALAELYDKYLEESDKAKEHYEKIIFEHPDSIYFVAARKKYRQLRGDAIN